MKFSSSTLSFYDEEIAEEFPGDAVDVTDVEFAQIMLAFNEGSTIEADSEGRPIAVPVPPPSLDDLRASAVKAITGACNAQIVGGFISAALGAPHLYPSKATDQLNLTANVVSSIMPGVGPGWMTPQLCADASGAWAYRPHSAAQIQTVGVDAKAAIAACLLRKDALIAEIEAADSAEDIAAVSWAPAPETPTEPEND